MLSDAGTRKEYDAVRAMSRGGARFTAGSGPSGGFSDDVFSGFFSRQSGRDRPGGGNVNMDDLLAGLFANGGGGAGFGAGAPRTGSDVEASTTLSFRQAVEGDTVTLQRADGSTVTTRVPAGVKDGQKIRLRGKGNPGPAGNGDLILTVTVRTAPAVRPVRRRPDRDGAGDLSRGCARRPDHRADLRRLVGHREAAARHPVRSHPAGARARASSARTAPPATCW